MSDVRHGSRTFATVFDVVVVGAGACGLTAGLAAADGGAEVLVLERDESALGSTAMSTGLIPAAGTPDQAERGIEDTPAIFAKDILDKTKARTDADLVRKLAEESADTVLWLRDVHGVPLTLLESFLYPGHSHKRMYGTPKRTGSELQAALEAALHETSASLLTAATVQTLYVDDDAVIGVAVGRPDGGREDIGCGALILACCGFGGAADLVRHWIPDMADAVYHGHSGNKGDAVLWGEALGAKLCDMTGYQGHGGLAAGYGAPILWPVIMEGGYQVNGHGRRFSNEAEGYSEQAAKVNAQPGHVAWTIFDERLHLLMQEFDDYHDLLRAGAVMEAQSLAKLAVLTGLPADALAETAATVEAALSARSPDEFGRVFAERAPLTAPFRAVKVTGALFHTQGGLAVDGEARVLREAGGVFPNLFAGGGAARGVSGPDANGYLAGNGLLTATTLGKLAGRAAAGQIRCAL
jgi:fumarate reductase flavoprotein subunit